MTIRPDLSQRIEHEIEMLKPEPIGHINYEGILHRGLPVFGTIGEVWLLRADGSLWRVDSDFGVPLAPLPERLRTMALVAGTERATRGCRRCCHRVLLQRWTATSAKAADASGRARTLERACSATLAPRWGGFPPARDLVTHDTRRCTLTRS